MDDQYYMSLALQLAEAAVGQTSPNPTVGAVVVKDGQIIGTGNHLFAGGPHAEIYALQVNPELNAGATLYVTLEPCCHFGKTPPCVDAVIAAKIKRVVIAACDPNPLVNGGGVKRLQDAGIQVEVGLMAAAAAKLNQSYLHYIQHRTPYITLKAGMSLDGKLATCTGESKWITSEAARLDARRYRYTHDAILVGVNTIIADDPSLTTRLDGVQKNPIRIVLDRTLRTPLTAKVMTDGESETWIVTTNQVSAKQLELYKNLPDVKIVQLPTTKLSDVMPHLGSLGITSVLVEGGNQIHSSFLQDKLPNQMVLYMAPKLLGGVSAPQFFANTGFNKLADALQLKFDAIEAIGDDIKIIATPVDN